MLLLQDFFEPKDSGGDREEVQEEGDNFTEAVEGDDGGGGVAPEEEETL